MDTTAGAIEDDGDVAGVAHPDRGAGRDVLRRRRITYRAMQTALIALAMLAVLDIWTPALGVDSRVVTDRAADGTILRVDHPVTVRPALGAPIAIEVENPDGLDPLVEVAISRPWIEAWDVNGLVPEPDSSTGDPDWVVYEFEAPDGPALRVFLDARLEPGWQRSVAGVVQLRSNGESIAEVELETSVRP